MKALIFLLSLYSNFAFAGNSMGIDEAINSFFGPLSESLASIVFYSIDVYGASLPLIVLWLVVASVFFTFYFNFINLKSFKRIFKILRGDYFDPHAEGEVTHFQALTTALSSTIGLGNIAGVAVAISLGGPGATFWMILIGLFSMTTKFVECTLGVKYRNINPDGSVSGGPMYYLSKGLKDRNMPTLGKYLAIFFSFCMIFSTLGGGNMFQVNQAYQQFVTVTGGADSYFFDKAWLFGLVIASIVAIVIIGGIKRIAHVTEILVPFMGGIYLLSAITVICIHWAYVPEALSIILSGAFSPEGVTGGVIGVMIQGMKRATFSSEAGVGTAAIAHSAAKTNEPIEEGLVSLYEPFIDTVVICTATALVIVISGSYLDTELGGVQLTSNAFATVIDWFPYLLSVCVILFAVSTIISSAYYMVKASTYIFGENKYIELILKFIFCTFTVFGATLQLSTIIDLTDSLFFTMAIANIFGLYILAPEVKKDLKLYLEKNKLV